MLRATAAVALSWIALGCAHAPTAPPPSSPSRLLGEALPTFRRPTLQGGAFDTAAVKGRIVVVDFYADYCQPCQRTLPALEALHRRLPGLTIVAVSLDETPDRAWR